jgi:hypothetical protein
MDAGEEQNLGLEHIADAGHDALIEENICDLRIGPRGNATYDFFGIEICGKEIRPDATEIALPTESTIVQEFGDRDVEADGDEAIGGDDHAHVTSWSPPSFRGTVDVPAPVHPHMRPEMKPAGEVDDQMFAGGANTFDGAAGNPFLVIDPCQQCQRSLEPRDLLSGERFVQSACGAKDGVALRHWRLAADTRARSA